MPPQKGVVVEWALRGHARKETVMLFRHVRRAPLLVCVFTFSQFSVLNEIHQFVRPLAGGRLRRKSAYEGCALARIIAPHPAASARQRYDACGIDLELDRIAPPVCDLLAMAGDFRQTLKPRWQFSILMRVSQYATLDLPHCRARAVAWRHATAPTDCEVEKTDCHQTASHGYQTASHGYNERHVSPRFLHRRVDHGPLLPHGSRSARHVRAADRFAGRVVLLPRVRPNAYPTLANAQAQFSQGLAGKATALPDRLPRSLVAVSAWRHALPHPYRRGSWQRAAE